MWKLWKRAGVYYAVRKCAAEGVFERESLRTRDRKVAEATVQRRNLDLVQPPDPVHSASRRRTVGDSVRTYLVRTDPKVSEATRKIHRSKAGHVVRIFGKDSPIGDVTYKSVHAYIEQRSQETTCQCSSAKPPRTCTNECPRVSRHTIAKELCVLRGILAEARMDHEFAESIDLVVPAYATAYKPVETFLSIAQVHRLADALPEERGAFVCFIASTGARLSEALAAVGADVDLTSWRVRLHGTKTVGSDRTVAIDELWRPTLARALEQARQGDGPLFDRWPMLHRSLRAACRRAGIPGVSPNDLRRSFASVLVQDGVDPTLVGRLLGHTSSAMVEKVYGRRTVDSDAVLLARRHGVRTAAEPPTPAPAAPASRPAATPAPATVYPVGTRPWIPVGSTRPGGLLN